MVQLYMVRRDFGFKTILSQSTHYWLAGMIMFMITITIEQMFSPTIIHTGVIAIIGGAVYIGILLGMRDSVLMEGISLKHRLKTVQQKALWAVLKNLRYLMICNM